MIQINVNYQGDPGPDPVLWVIDNGHSYSGIQDLPGRMIFRATEPEPSPYGSHIEWKGQILAYLLVPPDGYVGEVAGDPCNMTPPSLHFAPPPLSRPHWDGTYLRNADGSRYVHRRMSGFLDYKLFLDGGANAVRPLWQQAHDLGCLGRRVFPHIVKITDFNPVSYGERYWSEIPAFFGLASEYRFELDIPVLTDSGYRGWSLQQSQEFWVRWNETVFDIPNRWISLTNEYDHDGNLVGSPDDYLRPKDPLVSQGSAVSDTPPPRPGWNRREWHLAKDWPKVGLTEDMYYNRCGVDSDGKVWGPVLPTDMSESPRFDDDPQKFWFTPWLAADLAYQTVAFGDGMTFHCEAGKWSQFLPNRQAACCAAAMRVLESAK